MTLAFAGGRRREAALLTSLLTRTAEEGARLALVEGPRGVGKRTLVDAFVDAARRDGALVLTADVRAGEPFSPLDTLVEEALAILGRAPRGVELGCPHGCHSLWFHHPSPSPANPERALEAQRLHLDSLRRLLGALGALGPTVLVVRGLAFASADVVAHLTHLISEPETRGAAPRYLVVGIADDAGPTELRALAEHPRTTRITLRGLDEDALKQVLVSPEVVARILARTGGAPDAVGRLLSAEPPTPREHLEARLAQLGAEARAVFDALAVLGAPCALADVAVVAGTPIEPGVRAELERLSLARVRGEVLSLADPEDAARILEELDSELKRSLHLRAAELFASRRRSDEAARQALAAGAPHVAADHARRAAVALAARQAHREAASLLSEIRLGIESEETRAMLDPPLADALLSAGDVGAAVAPARRAFEAEPSSAAAGRRICRALVLSGRIEEAERVLCRAEAMVRESGDGPGAVALSALLAELCYQSGRLKDAERRAREVVDAGAAVGEARLEALQTLAKVALAAGDLAEAESRYRTYEVAACEAGSARHEALAIGGLGVAMLTAGDLAAAERTLGRCAKLAERARDNKARALAQHNLAVTAHLRHDYGVARERYEEAIRLLSLLGNRSSLARAAYNLGELYETFGAFTRARAMCEYGAQAGGPDVAPRATAEGLLLRGRIALAEGDHEGADTAFRAAHAILAELDPIRAAASAAGLARVAIRQDRHADAEGHLTPVGPVSAARRADLALAAAELALARDDDAIGAAERALAAAEAADEDRFLLEAMVLLARAQYDAGLGGRARALLRRAAELDASMRARVPEDLVPSWEDRPARRAMLSLMSGGRVARARASRGESRRLGIVGVSEGMQRVRRVIDRVGPSDCNVLLRGESGTGKELVARALHRVSPRSEGPLIAVNCAAIVEALLLSELFGHEKGAFTGAMERQVGRFEQAHGGTLFLDEIGDISPAVQAALLRVLSERAFERVGGRQTIRVDVRVIAATNRDLEAMVREGTFREDLYYRLNEVSIGLPPLRDRRDDVPLLAEHVLSQVAAERGEEPKRLTRRALVAMTQHPWPGNVRQLENVLRASTLFADGEEVDATHLDLHGGVSTGERSEVGGAPMPGDEVALCYERLRDGGITLRDLKKEIERDLIERALSDSDGNISKAAELLGMKRPRLSQLVKEYGLRQTDLKLAEEGSGATAASFRSNQRGSGGRACGAPGTGEES